MFRPPTDAEEELEQAWQLLWQAYGYPRGDIDELQKRLASMDRATMTTTEYAALETRVIRLVRLEKFRRAIEKMRLVRIERDDTQEELRALQRGGDTAREMELRLTIDELRDEVEELRAGRPCGRTHVQVSQKQRHCRLGVACGIGCPA